MTTCKECKNEISTTAKSCPHCGAYARRQRGGKAVAAIVGTILLIAIASGNKTEKPVTVAAQTIERTELAKANPDWSKVGTKLSAQCVREIQSGRVSRYCEAEGQAWSDGLTVKLNDPRFRKEMDDMVSGRR